MHSRDYRPARFPWELLEYHRNRGSAGHIPGFPVDARPGSLGVRDDPQGPLWSCKSEVMARHPDPECEAEDKNECVVH